MNGTFEPATPSSRKLAALSKCQLNSAYFDLFQLRLSPFVHGVSVVNRWSVSVGSPPATRCGLVEFLRLSVHATVYWRHGFETVAAEIGDPNMVHRAFDKFGAFGSEDSFGAFRAELAGQKINRRPFGKMFQRHRVPRLIFG